MIKVRGVLIIHFCFPWRETFPSCSSFCLPRPRELTFLIREFEGTIWGYPWLCPSFSLSCCYVSICKEHTFCSAPPSCLNFRCRLKLCRQMGNRGVFKWLFPDSNIWYMGWGSWEINKEWNLRRKHSENENMKWVRLPFLLCWVWQLMVYVLCCAACFYNCGQS